MNLQTLFWLLATSATAAVSAATHASPPLFPDGCRVLLTNNSVVSLGPARNLTDLSGKLVEEQACYKLGGPCNTILDCRPPSLIECNLLPKARPTVVIAIGLAECVDGTCRNAMAFEDEPCNCLNGCYFKANYRSSRDQTCIEGRCVAAECTPCGEPVNNRTCCGSGIAHDGKCVCATGVGEGCGTNPSQCDAGNFNDQCCGKGTDNEGRCCATGYCNGACAHQPK